MRLIPGLMPQESNQVIRLVERIGANFRRAAIARPEPGAFGGDIEPFYGYPFPAQAAGCGKTRLVHSQYKGFDPRIECFSTGPRMHEWVISHIDCTPPKGRMVRLARFAVGTSLSLTMRRKNYRGV